jgi:hypothetical protein
MLGQAAELKDLLFLGIALRALLPSARSPSPIGHSASQPGWFGTVLKAGVHAEGEGHEQAILRFGSQRGVPIQQVEVVAGTEKRRHVLRRFAGRHRGLCHDSGLQSGYSGSFTRSSEYGL